MKIVIVGNGVAGITCAMSARQRDKDADITVVGGETEYFFSRTALMYAYMDVMTRQQLEPFERKVYKQQRIELVKDWVIDLNASAQTVTLQGGGHLAYDKLVLAVGATPNMFPWKGMEQARDGVVHFVSMQDLDRCERLTPSTKRAVVIGGGLIGIELVECLRFHGVDVSFLIREPYYWPMALGQEEGEYVASHMREHGVDVRLREEMTRVHVDDSGRVASIETNQGEQIECQMLGIAAGVKPNIQRLRDWREAPELGRGIIVNEQFETSLPNVYAIGDCAEIHPKGKKPYNEQIWYSAKRHGRVVGRNLFDDGLSYEPPLFFNSSKFFEIEYTTVGEVMGLPEGTKTIYRKMPDKPISQRILYVDGAVKGFNMLGSRWDHEVLSRWIHERRSPEFVLRHLHHAQYNVEFGRAALGKMTEEHIPLVHAK